MLEAVGIGVYDVEVYSIEIYGIEVCGIEVYSIEVYSVEVYSVEVVKDLTNKLRIRSVIITNYRNIVPVGNATTVLKVYKRLVNIDLEDYRGEGKSLYIVGQKELLTYSLGTLGGVVGII